MKRILVVDDSDIVWDVLSMMIHDVYPKAIIFFVENGEVGLNCLTMNHSTKEKIDFVITESIFPVGMTGKEMLERAAKEGIEVKSVLCSDIPISMGDWKDIPGCIGFVKKPEEAGGITEYLRRVFE